jgi:tetratricopeptide (TPR) repeat protein
VLKKIKNNALNKEACLLIVQLHNDLGQYAQAISQAKLTLALFPKDAELQCQLNFFIGVNYRKLTYELRAINYLQQSVRIDSSITNAEAAYNLAFLYIETKQLTAFEQVAPKLLKWESYFLNTYLLMLESAILQQNTPLLKERLVALQPYLGTLDTIGIGIVSSLLIEYKLDNLFATLSKHYPLDSEVSITLQAKQLLAHKNYSKVIDLLSEYSVTQQPNASLLYMLAFAHHSLTQYDKAFVCYTEAAATKLIEVKATNAKYEDYFPKLKQLSRVSSGLNNIAQLTTNNIPEGLTISFVLGFPRSGTTLLDNVLDTQKKSTCF